jgi:hypothetical protein
LQKEALTIEEEIAVDFTCLECKVAVDGRGLLDGTLREELSRMETLPKCNVFKTTIKYSTS